MVHTIKVDDVSPREQYTAAAGQTVFDIPWKFFENSHLKVYLTPAGQEPDDPTDILAEVTDYTVIGAGTNTGARTITLTSGATVNDTITLQGDVPIQRLSDFNDGDFKADTVNDQFDIIFQIMLQLEEHIKERMLLYKQTVNLGNIDLSLPAPEALNTVRWNAAGDALENVSLPDDYVELAAATAALFASFQGQYYGPAASDPSLDPNGDAPTIGDFYYNTVAKYWKVYNGTTWDLPASTVNVGTADNEVPLNSNLGSLSKTDRSILAIPLVREWTGRLSSVETNVWRTISWGAGANIFVSIGSSGLATCAMSSPDGITWTTRTSVGAHAWYDVCWSESLTLFVAVGIAGTGNRVMTSPDGITWTIRTSAADNSWWGVCWSPELTLFVAVGTTGTGNRVMTSPDGSTWTIRTSAADNDWRKVCWSPELTLFVAVGATGTGNRVMTSPDGITWTTQTSAADFGWNDVCWSPELSLFVAVGTGGGSEGVMTSPDGINWTSQTSANDFNNWTKICWSPELSLFVAVGTNFGKLMTSSDGITWTDRAASAAQSWYGVCWSPEHSLFVACSLDGTNKIMTSL